MVNFVQNDSRRSGIDARIEPRESVVQSVLEAVVATSGDAVISGDPKHEWADVGTSPPLYEFINPDALEALYTHAQDHQATADWTTTFRYADADVSVTSAGTVTVEPARSDDSDQRVHGCPDCEEGNVDVNDDRFVIGATLQCPECGHEWDVSY